MEPAEEAEALEEAPETADESEPAPEAAEAAEEAEPAQPVCRATLTLNGEMNAASRRVFFAFANAGCALLQMTPEHADLENIFIELTEDESAQKGGAEE